MHLYFHIPFCHEICPYCSFYKHKPGQTSQKDFVTALLQELRWWSESQQVSLTPHTIYFGGGTPSLLSCAHLELLFTGLAKQLDLSKCTEITLEANPSTFGAKKARLLKELGVTRISLGVQSFDETLLATLGRDHSAQQAEESYRLLEDTQFDHLNVDLMFSVPGQSVASWEQTLHRACALKPAHLSAYNLTYEEDTAYFQKFLAGDYQDLPEHNETLFLRTHQILSAHHYDHYETSNYAQAGATSQHNQAYWRGRPYLGIGPSAVSCLDRQRSKNVSDTADYIHRVGRVGHATHEIETLDDEAWRLERLALQLRTQEGLEDLYLTEQQAEVAQLIETGLATHNTQTKRLSLTLRGSCLVDAVAEYLA